MNDEPQIILPKGVRKKEERSPDLAFRVTNREGAVLHLGVDQGDIVGVVIRGAPAPLPFRVVATNSGHGRMSLVPLGGKYDPGEKEPS